MAAQSLAELNDELQAAVDLELGHPRSRVDAVTQAIRLGAIGFDAVKLMGQRPAGGNRPAHPRHRPHRRAAAAGSLSRVVLE